MDLGCYIVDGFQSAATNVMDQLAQQSTTAALNALQGATFWLRPKTPAVAEQHGSTWTNSGTVEFLQHNLLAVTSAVFVIAIVIAGMRIAWEQRARPLQELLKAILTFVVVAAAGTATMQLLVACSDSFSVYIVDQAAANISLTTAFGGAVDGNGRATELVSKTVPALLACTIAFSVIVASLIQMILMLVRSAMLVLLAGTFPLAAVATNTEIGRTWFRKFCGWALAFIAYKPAAALVYAAAMMMAREGGAGTGDALVKAMSGMMMMLLAILALPALLRFMVPVTAAVAGGNAGMGSSVADPGGMATGAINVGSSGSGRGAGSAAGGFAGGGGGATGAQSVGAKAAGAAAGPAGVGLAAARKAAGGLAGAASHSAGESGGGSVTPPSANGPMAGRSRSSRSSQHSSSNSTAQQRVPEPVGPSGSR
jgi:hypothetical protein